MPSIRSYVICVLLLAVAGSALAQRALNPGAPALEERYQLSKDWSVTLPGKFNRRLEHDKLVLSRPGFAMWITIWGNDPNEPTETRLTQVKRDIPKEAFEVEETSDPRALRISYRLKQSAERASIPTFHGVVVGDSGQVQLAMQFEHEADLPLARQILRSVNEAPVR